MDSEPSYIVCLLFPSLHKEKDFYFVKHENDEDVLTVRTSRYRWVFTIIHSSSAVHRQTLDLLSHLDLRVQI